MTALWDGCVRKRQQAKGDEQNVEEEFHLQVKGDSFLWPHCVLLMILIIYLLLAVFGPCCGHGFSLVVASRCSSLAVEIGLLMAMDSLTMEHRL